MKEKILSVVTEPLEKIGVKVKEIKFEKEDGVNTLFITILSDNVVDTDLCAKASEIISPLLDELDIEELKNEYVLDVGSEGVEDEQ